jgi:hypothetical protein
MSDGYVNEDEAKKAIEALRRQEEAAAAAAVAHLSTSTPTGAHSDVSAEADTVDEELEKLAEIHAQGRRELERLDKQIAALNTAMLRTLPMLCMGLGRMLAGWGDPLSLFFSFS